MCGIAGEVVPSAQARHRQPERDAEVAGMIARMRVRGPDGVGFRAGEGASLGMCRLAIIDVAGGDQPISTADGRFHIIYNGECYGVDPLRRELEQRGRAFATRTDTEVVLNAYAEYGAAALDRLNGMFALAIWDSRERELFLARDRLGIKPLFYWQDGERLVFSSTLRGIQARRDFTGTLDPEAIDLYLATGFVPAPRTILREVRKLPAGHFARWRDGRLDVRAWWDVPLARDAPPATATTDEIADEVADLLRDAARIRLVSERPVGLCLSGGIDSGLLAWALADQDIQAFSMGFRERSYDESQAAARVAARYHLPHHVLVGDIDSERDFGAVVEQFDEPVSDVSGVALYNLSRLVSRHVTVALSGTGGDELFGGYLRYAGARLARVTRFLPGLSLLPRLLGRDESKSGVRGQIARFAQTATVSPLESYLRFLLPASPDLCADLRRPELVASLGGFSAAQVFEEHFARAAGHSLLTRIMYTDIKTNLADRYLVKEDRMTMAHSVEGRVPFLDYRLVARAFALPDRMKIRGIRTKLLLRHIARTRLPADIARAPKQGFVIPATAWLRDRLRGRLEATLRSPAARIHEHVRADVVDRLVREHVDDRADHGRVLWSLLTLETWLRCAPGL